MTKKLIILLVVGIIAFLSFSIWSYYNKHTNVLSINNNDKKIVAEIPKANIKLYSIKEENGMYTEFILEIGDNQRHFNRWENTTNPTYSPKLLLSDLSGDKTKELIIILTYDTGTGINKQEVHIFNSSMQEFEVENPIHIIYKNVKTELSPKEVKIYINGYTTILDKRYIPNPQNLFKDIAFGNIINYRVEVNKLYAYIAAQIGPASFIGDIKISYVFQGKMYVMDTIEFIPIKLK